MTDRYLIVGLGNPGRQYAATRHNVGFWVVDELVRRHQLPPGRRERKSLVTDGVIRGQRVILAQPQTYMNLSGEAVRALMDFYRLEPERLIVIHDDLDTPLGEMRVRKTGGHGGQNGLRSIIQHLGTQEFARVRFGISRPPGRMAASSYVLQPFVGDAQIVAREMVEKAADAVESWLEFGIEPTMSRFNGGEPPPRKSQQDLKDELAVVRRAHELAPNDPAPLEKMIGLLRGLGDEKGALAQHLKAAELYERQGEARRALAHRERAVALKPGLVDVQRAIAEQYAEMGNSKKAAERWLLLGEYHEGQGDLAGAYEAVERALQINPQHGRAQQKLQMLRRRITQ